VSAKATLWSWGKPCPSMIRSLRKRKHEKTQMESEFYLIILIRLNSCWDLKYVLPFPDDYLTGLWTSRW
jgi:hypothetical protein